MRCLHTCICPCTSETERERERDFHIKQNPLRVKGRNGDSTVGACLPGAPRLWVSLSALHSPSLKVQFLRTHSPHAPHSDALLGALGGWEPGDTVRSFYLLRASDRSSTNNYIEKVRPRHRPQAGPPTRQPGCEYHRLVPPGQISAEVVGPGFPNTLSPIP